MNSRSPTRTTRFAQKLLAELKRLGPVNEGATKIVAVSGGADSVALLLSLDELVRGRRIAMDLIVAHLDHGIRGAAAASDAEWVRKLALGLGYKAEIGRAAVGAKGPGTLDNLEQAARRARLAFLRETAIRHGADAVLLAHTLDDQAETVMLRLLRGSGTDGLGGMSPVRRFDAREDLFLVRPLLEWARRRDTEAYCRERQVLYLTDEMNLDEEFARVRVRRGLLPAMERFNPRIVETLCRTARLLRDESAALDEAAGVLLGEALAPAGREGAHPNSAPAGPQAVTPRPLRVEILARAKPALRRRALRLWLAAGRGDLRRLDQVHILSVERLLEGRSGGRRAELPGGASVSRKGGWLGFQAAPVIVVEKAGRQD